ncbi:MAG: hypothetical protein ACLFN4_04630 [Candidatus Acetothermia bacterium]
MTKEKELDLAKDLIDFIYSSPSPFHVVANIKERLTAAGFNELEFKDEWDVSKGGEYFVTRNDSAIIAFILGRGEIKEDGFRIIGRGK